MFEDIIVQLDQLGVEYMEDYDAGVLTVDVAALDKIALIEVINLANNSGLDFTVDEASLTIMAGAPAEAPIEEEEPIDGDFQAAALNEYL